MKNFKCDIYKIDGAENFRDLGGYDTKTGKTVKQRFFRSASLSALTDKGKADICELGIDCVVDLRSSFEIEKNPDAIIGYPGVHYEKVPMLDHIMSNVAQGLVKFPSSMAKMYMELLKESPQSVKSVFDIFAGPYNSILFHCTAGKDRTGIIAMFLLSLAGVDEDTIIEDYSYTEMLMDYADRPPELPDYLFRSMPETMRTTIDFLNQNYGGAVPYLKNAGISEAGLKIIKGKIIDS